MHYEGTTALVTGASSGIGAEFAHQLARKGADVVLVGRRENALNELAVEISTRTGRAIYPIPLDLSVARSGQMLKARLDEEGILLDTVINCAGMGLTKPFLDSTEDEIRAQLQLNLVTLVEISQAFLPDLLSSGRGALLNIGSLTGYMPVPCMAIYAAAKASVIRFTEALAYELRSSNLTVMVVSPGPTRTGFYAQGGTSTSGVRFETPEQVVATALNALERRNPPVSVVSGWTNRIIARVARMLPTRVLLKLTESQPAN